MTGRPRSGDTPCSGMWTCAIETDGRHCVCVQDWTPRPGLSRACCNCDHVERYEED